LVKHENDNPYKYPRNINLDAIQKHFYQEYLSPPKLVGKDKKGSDK